MERLPTSISEIQAFLNNYDITVSNTPTNSLHAYETMQALLSCNESHPFDRLHRISSQFGYFCSQQSLHSQPFPYLKYATSTCEYFLPLWDKSQAKMSFLPVLFSKVSVLSCNLVIMIEGQHTWGTSCDEDITLSLALESEEALGGCVLTWMRLESGQRVALLRVDGWHATIPPNDTEWSHFTTLYHKARLELIMSQCALSVMIIDVGSRGEENAWGLGPRAGLILSTDNILRQIHAIDTDNEVEDISEAPPVNNEVHTGMINEHPSPEEVIVTEPSISQLHSDSNTAYSEYQQYLSHQQSQASRRLQERLQRRRMQNNAPPPIPADSNEISPPRPPTEREVVQDRSGQLQTQKIVNIPRAVYETAACCKQLFVTREQYAFVCRLAYELMNEREQSRD